MEKKKVILSVVVVAVIFIILFMVVGTFLVNSTYSMISDEVTKQYIATAIKAILGVAFILLPIFAFFFVINRYRKVWPETKKPGGKTPTDEKGEDSILDYWLEHNGFILAVLWLVILALPYFIPDFTTVGADGKTVVVFSPWKWWTSHIFTATGIFLLLGFSVFGYFTYHDLKNPFRYKLVKVGQVLFGIVFFWYLFIGPQVSMKGWMPEKTNLINASNTTSMMKRAETQDFVTTFWYQNLPIGDAREMLNITQCESGFNHWDDNGNVIVNTNDDGSTDTCVMQVNSIWQAKADELGHNLKTLNGCLQMALYIRKEKGPQEWTGCYSKVTEVKDDPPILIPAPPLPEWSPVQKVKANCIWENNVPLNIKDDSGKVHVKNPGEAVNVITWTFQISVPEGSPPGVMRYICR